LDCKASVAVEIRYEDRSIIVAMSSRFQKPLATNHQ
jgi:hypothetical protein